MGDKTRDKPVLNLDHRTNINKPAAQAAGAAVKLWETKGLVNYLMSNRGVCRAAPCFARVC